jgi:hypothetical protein
LGNISDIVFLLLVSMINTFGPKRNGGWIDWGEREREREREKERDKESRRC